MTVLATLPPRLLCTCSIAEHETLESPCLTLSPTQQQLKHQCGINIAVMLNPKHSSVAATREEMNSIAPETRAAKQHAREQLAVADLMVDARAPNSVH